MNCLICKDGTMKEGTGTYLKTICCAASHVVLYIVNKDFGKFQEMKSFCFSWWVRSID